MSKIGDITTLALVIGGGYLLLKNWAGIKDFFGSFAEGIGTIAGGAPGTGEPGLSSAVFTGVDVPVVETVEDIPEVTEVHIPSFIDLVGLGTVQPQPIVLPEIDPTAQPPSLIDLLNPLQRVPVAPPPASPPPTYTPTPTVTTPLGTTGWMQTPDMVGDPAYPAGRIGGR